MGITIDETISEFEILKKSTFGYMRANQAFIKSIETMRKYQKIEEIVGNYGFDTSWLCLKKIREVIEGGKID
jgi:hypothetical protein